MGVGQVGAGGGPGRRAGRRGRGVSPGHWAESRGVLARENRGRRWRGPGGGGGRGPSPPGWDGEGAGALGGVSSGSPRHSPRPLSSAATQTGARPTWGSGRRASSARRAHGAQPPPLLPSPGAGAAPPDARPRLGRLGQLARRRSSRCSLARLPVAAGIAGASLPGAGRGGAEGGAWARGAGGEGAAPREGGRERASQRASRAFVRSSSAPRSPPGGRRTHRPRTDSARKPRRSSQVSRPRRPLGAPGTPPRLGWWTLGGESPRAPSAIPGPGALTGGWAGSGGGVDTTKAGGGRPEPAGLGGPGPRFVRLSTGARMCVSGSSSPDVCGV